MDLKALLTQVKTVPAREATTLAQTGGGSYFLLDVRQREEYLRGHIPGAHLLPLPELEARLDELPSDRSILVY